MSPTTFLGMRGTGDWGTDERPKNFREGILFDNPNGTAPLTAILSRMDNTRVDDPEFSWWTQELPTQSATITAPSDSGSGGTVWTNTGLTTEMSSGAAVAGQPAFFGLDTEADRKPFKIGHQVVFRQTAKPHLDINARVTSNTVAEGDGVFEVGTVLLESEHNADDLKACTVVQVVGSVNEEGASRPEAQSLDPSKHYNYTQIFRTSHEISRTAVKTRLRSKKALAGTRRDSLELHMMEIEKAFIFGARREDTSGTKPLRSTDGIISGIRRNTPANISDFVVDKSGTAWLTNGKTWLEDNLEQIFRYGDKEKLALCGSGALLALNRLADNIADVHIKPGEKAFGIKVTEWTTPFGSVNLLTHPLFSDVASTRNSMLIVEPRRLKYRFVDDTMFISDDLRKKRGGANSVDAYQEEYLTECGLEYSHTRAMGYLTQVGVG